MKQRIRIVLLFIGLIFTTSCSNGITNPQSDLIGQWAFISSENGEEAFACNLAFSQDGMLSTEGNWFVEGGDYDHVLIAPGRIKVSNQDVSQVISFVIEDEVLTLFFDAGSNQYGKVVERSSVSSVTADSPEMIQSTESPIPQSPTSTLTWTPTKTLRDFTPTIEFATSRTITPTNSTTEYITPTPKVYYPISNCASSQLHVGDSAYVSYEGGKNRLRSTPDTHPSNNIIGEILPGEVVEIIGGPKCNYGWILWKVFTTDDKTGWTPESDGDEFWLIPITTRQFCSDALPSRLIAGEMAFVEEEPDLANRVRSEPKTSAEIIDRIEPKGKMEVLEGPECGERAHWWKVKSVKTGIVGWTMESREDEYYLAPIP